jgi:hypothetical protein
VPIAHLATGFRSVLLHQQAYDEEGIPSPDVDERVEPVCLLYPRSWVQAVDAMPDERDLDYSFMGSLYRPEVYANRAWILDFARERFTPRSFLLLSEEPEGYRRLGPYDRTGSSEGVWVPKDAPRADRGFFNPSYFGVLRRSRFALCPAGDKPWSLRLFEAVLCGAIPIVEDHSHVGHNELERSLGYRAYLADEAHEYDPDIAAHNRRLFLEHQTLIGRRP